MCVCVDNQEKEAETVCRVLSQLARPLRLEPECLEAYAASLKVLCRERRVTSPVLAKAVVSLYVQVSGLCRLVLCYGRGPRNTSGAPHIFRAL